MVVPGNSLICLVLARNTLQHENRQKNEAETARNPLFTWITAGALGESRTWPNYAHSIRVSFGDGGLRVYLRGLRSLNPDSRAGESHVRGTKLLPWKEILILTVSPDSIGDLFGPFCRMLFAVVRSSEEPSATRSDRDAFHRAAGHAVRCHDLLRHRAVW